MKSSPNLNILVFGELKIVCYELQERKYDKED